MDFILFNFFSTTENAAAIVLLLSIFKYRVRDYIPQILLTGLTMSLISHSMRFEFNNSNLVPLVSLITLFLFIWIAFRVSLFYSVVISTLGFITVGVLEVSILLLLNSFGFLSQQIVEKAYSMQGYILQLITSIAAFSIAYFLRKKNYGFNWIPYSKSAKFRLKGENIFLFIVVIISVFVVGLVFYFTLSGYLHLIANIFLIVIVLILLFYLASRQEEKYYD